MVFLSLFIEPVQPSTSKSIMPQPEQTDPSMTTVMARTVPGLPLNSQLLNIINSPSVHKDRPYCLILNKGCPEEQMFHIDPAKSAHSPPLIAAPKPVLSTSTAGKIHYTHLRALDKKSISHYKILI